MLIELRCLWSACAGLMFALVIFEAIYSKDPHWAIPGFLVSGINGIALGFLLAWQ